LAAWSDASGPTGDLPALVIDQLDERGARDDLGVERRRGFDRGAVIPGGKDVLAGCFSPRRVARPPIEGEPINSYCPVHAPVPAIISDGVETKLQYRHTAT
jgi:hypothetical protein